MAKDKNTSKKDQNAKTSLPPSGFKIIVREVWRDKVAFVSFCIIVAILLFTFVGSLFLNKSQVTEINIAEAYYALPAVICNTCRTAFSGQGTQGRYYLAYTRKW